MSNLFYHGPHFSLPAMRKPGVSDGAMAMQIDGEFAPIASDTGARLEMIPIDHAGLSIDRFPTRRSHDIEPIVIEYGALGVGGHGPALQHQLAPRTRAGT